jgi:predicted lipoprotein
MRPFVWLAILLPALGLGLPAQALDKAAASKVMANAVDGYIRPAYADFHAKASALVRTTERFCAATSDDGLKSLQAGFADTVASWGAIEFLRLGPVLEENRFERVLFYPDRKSTGLKQVQALLAKPDESVTDASSLKTRSVAIQGLGAFEFLFFGSYPEAIVAEKNGFRCRYGLAVARNVESIAAELQAAWDAPDGVARHWKAPGADNPVYRDDKEAMSALIGIMVHGLEMVRDQRIKHFYRGKGQKVSPRLAVYWRSGLTMTALKANVDGLVKFWVVADLTSLLAADAHSLSESASFDLRNASSTLGKLDQPTAERLADTKYLGKLDFIEFNLKDGMTRIDTDVGGAIGLGAGFSFADGD